MKLKGFDLDEIFDYEFKEDTMNKIKEELKSYVVYFTKNDTMGICFIEQKQNIVNILKKYKDNTRLSGQFKNVSSFYKDKDYDWDDVYLGELTLQGSKVWSEFAKLLESEEDILIQNIENIEFGWYRLQKIAIRISLTREENKMKQNLNKMIEEAENEYCEVIGINEYKIEKL
jgi:hypothetical protein